MLERFGIEHSSRIEGLNCPALKQYLDNDIFIFNPFQEQSHACNFLSYVSSDRKPPSDR